MKQREVIENWVNLLGLDQDSPDRVESFGDRKYKFGLYLLNQDGNALKLRKGAIHELVIEDDIMNWFHAGHVTVSNPDDILERVTEISTGDGPQSEKIKANPYRYRGDCRDLLYLTFEPHIAPGDPGETLVTEIDSSTYTIKFLFSIYATEDVVSPNGRKNKLQKMYFHDYRYQLLREKNLYYSTAKMRRPFGRNTRESISPAQLNNSSRSKPTGEIMQDILKMALPTNDTTNLFSFHWNFGGNEEFYTSPSNFKAIDDLNYILDRHISTSDYDNQPCLLRLQRHTERWNLLPVGEFFKRSKHGILPGVLQTEHFLISNDSETEDVKIPPGAKTFGMGIKTLDVNYHFPDISVIDDYIFSEVNGVDCQEILNSVISHKHSVGDKQFNISLSDNNVKNIHEKFQSLFIDHTFGGEKGHGATAWLSDSSREKNFNFNVQYTSRPKSTRNNLLLAAFLLGNTIQFQSTGETSRRAGVWIAVDRGTNYIDSDYESKVLGQYFVTRVLHIITPSGEYKNDIMGVKPYFYRDMSFRTEDLFEKNTNEIPI
jgi:hypothetical protein